MNKNINEVKTIISFYFGIEPKDIGLDTIIDNSKLQGSVKIHLMYGELGDNGYKVSNYNNIKTFRELLGVLDLGGELKEIDSIKDDNPIAQKENEYNAKVSLFPEESSLNIGIDLLNINKLPKVSDFRENSFYTDNFSLKEIAYCLTKRNPYQSFAGKFAAKEAIVKANNKYKDFKFNTIEVLNDNNGTPYFEGLSISISHEDEMATAIATPNVNLFKCQTSLSEDIGSREDVGENVIEESKEVILDKKKDSAWLVVSAIVNVVLGGYIVYNHFFI